MARGTRSSLPVDGDGGAQSRSRRRVETRKQERE
ncbi:unnamed protein product [Ectocarpus sp. CCAP 1310/34]|nr:unnamed protein product [Ectocarpus sp. CCAP 1310/34]